MTSNKISLLPKLLQVSHISQKGIRGYEELETLDEAGAAAVTSWGGI